MYCHENYFILLYTHIILLGEAFLPNPNAFGDIAMVTLDKLNSVISIIIVLSLLLMILPFVMPDPGMMHCLAVAPTLTMSLMFIILYLVDQVQNMAEQLYLLVQIVLNVVALILNMLPFIVEPLERWHCVVAAPTLLLSTYFMVLYVVDQVQYEAETYYVLIELILTFIATINLLFVGKIVAAIYALFYVDLIVAFLLDAFCMHRERGLKF